MPIALSSIYILNLRGEVRDEAVGRRRCGVKQGRKRVAQRQSVVRGAEQRRAARCAHVGPAWGVVWRSRAHVDVGALRGGALRCLTAQRQPATAVVGPFAPRLLRPCGWRAARGSPSPALTLTPFGKPSQPPYPSRYAGRARACGPAAACVRSACANRTCRRVLRRCAARPATRLTAAPPSLPCSPQPISNLPRGRSSPAGANFALLQE